MLIDEIKTRIKAALKSGNTTEKEILRVALGEIQTEEARSGKKEADDTLAVAVIRKIVKANRETMEAATDPEQKRTLQEELVVLESLLPKTWDETKIIEALSPVLSAIKGANNDGQATGVAMKHLKSVGAPVDGKSVAEAIKKIRA